MKSPRITLLFLALAIIPFGGAFAAESSNFAGEYADKQFLNGQGIFQLSLEQNGKEVTVFFSAAYNNGQGATPEADGKGQVTSNGVLEFKFQDSAKNAGTGTVKHAGDDVIVSLKTSRVVDSRCLVFYKQNMKLKRLKK